MEYSLQMVFICENGAKSSITVSDVKPNLTAEIVSALMDKFISNNVFHTLNGDLVSKFSAQVVQREVTAWKLA